ncbi:L-type lectin-domain containing receptor kinase IX.1-like [Triticum aestivum]|uniref:L-type lectin-domain containing receptor kinase IX.1-like n=1 Tax=Triticum aestivum TaxID=4565 RepID=UPI001D00C4B9|nr:L-type lectin-domain containing receptor kinase IX.1-like [Triticum aestivum]
MAAAVSFSHQIHTCLMLLCYSIWSLHLPCPTSSVYFNANFSDPEGYDPGLSFQGDAYLDAQSRTLQLTTAVESPNIQNSVGRVFYSTPVPLWDNATGELARFSTSFTFRIKVNGTISGDGFAFFLGNYPPSSPDPLEDRQNLGLYNGNASTVATGNDRAVAVKFDTFLNVGVDTSSSHMGIDVNSIISQVYTNVTLAGNNLTSDLPMTCHIIYGNESKTLAAVLEVGDTTYHVNTSVDLRLMPNVVAIGFSGATGEADELHQIISWSFDSTLDLPSAPAPAWRSTKSPPPAPKTLPKGRLAKVTGPIIGVIAIVCIFVGVRRWQLCTRKKHHRALAGGLGDIGYLKLARATNEFAEENKLGQGGSASVYRGQLASPSRPVAIKRFKLAESGEERKAFEDELRIASRLRHRNLVELIGWCYGGMRNLVELICWWQDDRYTRLFLLVYELLPQGSLDQHLHGGNSWMPWSKRYEIILDLGSTLQYLHVDCEQGQQCIVHGDIKSSNVLLGSSYGAKLSDFGLARFVHHETGSQTTDVLQGTYGYIDPVFLDTSQRNRQSDIYSFGIVLLEMVSGRDPTMCLHDRPPLSSWIRSLYHWNDILDAADERLIRGESNVARQQMEHMLLIGLLCVHQDPSIRPSITHTMEAL